jgi:hypothetical protein
MKSIVLEIKREFDKSINILRLSKLLCLIHRDIDGKRQDFRIRSNANRSSFYKPFSILLSYIIEVSEQFESLMETQKKSNGVFAV